MLRLKCCSPSSKITLETVVDSGLGSRTTKCSKVKSDVIDLTIYSGLNAVGLVKKNFPLDHCRITGWSLKDSKPLLKAKEDCVQQGTAFKDDFT